MFRAKIEYTVGYGSEYKEVVANSFMELKAKVNNAKANIEKLAIKILSVESTGKCWRVTYNYPSGKKFVETCH